MPAFTYSRNLIAVSYNPRTIPVPHLKNKDISTFKDLQHDPYADGSDIVFLGS